MINIHVSIILIAPTLKNNVFGWDPALSVSVNGSFSKLIFGGDNPGFNYNVNTEILLNFDHLDLMFSIWNVDHHINILIYSNNSESINIIYNFRFQNNINIHLVISNLKEDMIYQIF